MAELLVKAVDATHGDPIKDRRACYKRGYLVVVRPDGHEWGDKERPPIFVVVKLPGASVAEVEQYAKQWDRVLQFAVVAQDLALDKFTLDVSASASGTSVSGEGGITRQMVEAFLTRWNAVVISSGANTVRFTIGIIDAISSQGFWDVNVSQLGFTEVSYSQANGIHRVRVDYSATAFASAAVEERVVMRGGLVISHNLSTKRITFDITRSDVRQKFEESVKQRVEGMVVRRRWKISNTIVAAAEANGGSLSTTKAALESDIQDQLTE